MTCRSWLTPLLGLFLLSSAAQPGAAQPGTDQPGAAQPGTDQTLDNQVRDLDELLQRVREERGQQSALNRQREARFLADKQQQRVLLDQARSEFESRMKQNEPLVAATEANAVELANLEQQLAALVEGMGDIASTFSEFSADFSAVMRESLVSAQFPGRDARLQALARAKTQPGISDMETLWLLVQEDMTEAGKIARLRLPVVAVDGVASEQEVVRIGVFSAVGDAGFLRYIPQTGELLTPSRQPAARYQALAQEFFHGNQPLSRAVIDPTRGNLIGLLSYSPTLDERIRQGGVIGLIILVLGGIGVLLTCWRGLHLGLTRIRLREQLRQIDQPREDNPLGRVVLSVRDIPLAQEELLQLKLDEAVLAEIPALERGCALIKLLAATAPLLGLLGTVTGMILTFQAISLFGTSDPKLMAGGISQALVTTVLGLVVAIPLLFGHSLVASLSRGIIQQLDEQSAGILARSAEQVTP